EDYRRRAAQLTAMRVLQFGGPEADADTILTRDGPCLFNDGRSKAEVHFWQRSAAGTAAAGSPAEMARRYMGVEQPALTDLVARFERRGGGWQLLGVKRWRFATGERAAAEEAQRAMYGYGRA